MYIHINAVSRQRKTDLSRSLGFLHYRVAVCALSTVHTAGFVFIIRYYAKINKFNALNDNPMCM